MNQSRTRKPQIYLVGGDAAILLGTFFLTLRFWFFRGRPDAMKFSQEALIDFGAYLIALAMFGLYETQTIYRSNKISTLTHVISAVVAAGLGLSSLFYLFPNVKLPRSVFLLQMSFVIPLLFLWRINFWRLWQEIIVPRRVLIVGTEDSGQTALGILEKYRSEYQIVGFLDDGLLKRTRKIGEYSVLGESLDLPTLVQQHKIDFAIVAVEGPKPERLIQAAFQCRMEGGFISDLMSLGETLEGRVLLRHARDSWFVDAPGFLILHNRMFRRVKRWTDIFCAAIGLILASPLLIAAMGLIRLESRGPVFFRQTRVGQNERLFSALKLRTMMGQAEGHSPYTAKKDSRVTKVGRILRFLRIDEIPQVWNVLKGEMSFVGPRAEWDILAKEYKEKIPYYALRHVVKPGITGWAQLNYPYGSSVEDAYRKLEYDLYYIKNMSLVLDLRVLFKTVAVVLLGKGAR
jgi:exopolysaccharide biosynthesis polyprenyl glycosylphosphotransferase